MHAKMYSDMSPHNIYSLFLQSFYSLNLDSVEFSDAKTILSYSE